MDSNIIFFEKDQDCRWISKEISDVFPLYLYDETEYEGQTVTFYLILDWLQRKNRGANSKMLEELGVNSVPTVADLPEGAGVFVTGYDADYDELQQLKARGVPVIDRPCPWVRKLRDQIIDFDNDSYQMVLVIDENHMVYDCFRQLLPKDCIVVQPANYQQRIRRLKASRPLCLLSYTVFRRKDVEAIAAFIRHEYPNQSHHLHHFKKTLCLWTKQGVLEEVEEKCQTHQFDEVWIICSSRGDRSTQTLIQQVEEGQAKPVIIEKAADIPPRDNTKKVGVLFAPIPKGRALLDIKKQIHSMAEQG